MMAQPNLDSSTPQEPIDPITVEVIGSALTSIGEEMGEALVRASHSTNIKERRDCSTALFDIRGNTLCQAEHIPMHLGSFIEMIPCIMERYPAEVLRPGDAFIGNDAYVGGSTHLPDIVVAEPIFVDGQLVAWAINTAHHSDFADRNHAHIYQEGLRIPPVRLYRAGILQQEIMDLILLNCQVPEERISDLRAQMAANRLGVRRMVELCARYGVDVVLAAGDELQNYAERKMRAGIRAIPDGVYRFSDVYDNPEIDALLKISVEITVKDDEIHLDFDAPAQVRAGLNMTHTALLSAVYFAVKAVVEPTVLANAGLARPIKVTAPEGSVVNCRHPAAVLRRVGTCQRVVDIIFGALAQAVPERVIAACNGTVSVVTFTGRKPSGEFWVYLETIAGGSGARATKDGMDGVHVHMTNTSNLPIEALEIEYPLTVLRYELAEGSGGPGKFRGGMGLRRVYRAEDGCRVEIDAARIQSSPWGLFGGMPGGRYNCIPGDGVSFHRGAGFMDAGEEITVVTPGAGGYGIPQERSLDAVQRDIRERIISPELARNVYPQAFAHTAPAETTPFK
jgi:N-methylhydantoinase B